MTLNPGVRQNLTSIIVVLYVKLIMHVLKLLIYKRKTLVLSNSASKEFSDDQHKNEMT